MKNIMKSTFWMVAAALLFVITSAAALGASGPHGPHSQFPPQPGLCYFLDSDGDCISGPPDFNAIKPCVTGRETSHIDGYSCRDLFDIDGDGIVAPGDIALYNLYKSYILNGRDISEIPMNGLPEIINVTIPENMTAGNTYEISAQVLSQVSGATTRSPRAGVGVIFRLSDPTMGTLEGRSTEWNKGDEYVNASEVFELTSKIREGGIATIKLHVTKKGIVQIEAVIPATPEKGLDEDITQEEQATVKNSKPVLKKIDTITVSEGDIAKVVPEATDADGDDLTYEFSAPLDENGEWQTTDRDSGFYPASVNVSDGEETATEYFRINVNGRRQPGIGVCFFADADGDCIIAPADVRAPEQCVAGRDNVRIPNYTCYDLFDLDGDGFVAPGDISIWRSMWHQMDRWALSGAPSEMNVVEMPSEVYVGEPFNLTVNVTDSGMSDGRKTLRAGIGVEFVVEEGSADLYGRRISNYYDDGWKEYVTADHVSELTGTTGSGAYTGGLATIRVTPTAAGNLVIDMGVEGDPMKYTNEFHKTVEFNVMERPQPSEPEMNVTLVADAVTGVEPVDVNFTCSVENGESPYTYKWAVYDEAQGTVLCSTEYGPVDETSYDYTVTLGAGNWTADCVVTDANGTEVASNNVTIRVDYAPEQPENHAPVIDHVNFPEGDVSGNVNISWNVFDPDNDSMTAVILVSYDNGTTWNDTGLGNLTKDNPELWNYTLNVNTADIANGDYMIRAIITDEHNASTEWTSQLVSIFNNHAPVIEHVNFPEGDVSGNVNISWNVFDPDGDNMSAVIYVSYDNGITWNDTGLGNLTQRYPELWNYTLNVNTADIANGDYMIRAIITDEHNASTEWISQLVRIFNNHAPVITTDYPIQDVYSGRVNISWNVVDPDNDSMTAVILVSYDNGTTWNDTGLGNLTQKYPELWNYTLDLNTADIANGYYIVKAIVTDEHNASAEYTSELFQIWNNHAPEFDDIADITMYEAQTVWFRVNAIDPEGDNVTYSAEGLPEGSYFWTDEFWGIFNGIFVWNPQYGQAGYYTVAFTATDGQLNSTRYVNIQVLAVAPEQQMHVTLASDAVEGTEMLNVNFTCSVQNGTAPYAYSWAISDDANNNSMSGGIMLVSEDVFSFNETLEAGNWTAVCYASDSDNRTIASNEVAIRVTENGNVTPQNHAPVITVDYPIQDVYSGRVNISWNVVDPDNDSMTAVILVSYDNGTTWNDTGLGNLTQSNPELWNYTLNVNTADIANGDYMIRAIITDEHNVSTEWTSGLFRILNNHAPEIAVMYPSGNLSGTVNFTWSIADPDGDNFTWTAEYSANNGAAWTVYNTADLNATGRYTLNTASVSNGVYLARVNATDVHGARTSSVYTIRIQNNQSNEDDDDDQGDDNNNQGNDDNDNGGGNSHHSSGGFVYNPTTTTSTTHANGGQVTTPAQPAQPSDDGTSGELAPLTGDMTLTTEQTPTEQQNSDMASKVIGAMFWLAAILLLASIMYARYQSNKMQGQEDIEPEMAQVSDMQQL